MLLRIADALRELGHAVTIVGPTVEGGILDAATKRHHSVVALAPGRRAYMADLRSWASSSRAVLWCHGLVPAVATVGLPRRVVHLHRLPRGAHVPLAHLARRGALATMVPSQWMAARVPGALVLPNWTEDPAQHESSTRHSTEGDEHPLRVGYLGRWAAEKGLDQLLTATHRLRSGGLAAELVLAGEPRFAAETDTASLAEQLRTTTVPVRALGWVRPAELFAQVDVLVVPSREPESFGLVAAEAMAAGVTVVVTTAGALPEVVGSDHPWVAHADDIESLTETIRRAITAPPGQRAAVIAQGRQRWLRDFSPQAGKDNLAALVRELALDELASSGFDR